MHKLQKSILQDCANSVLAFNRQHGLEHTEECNTTNLLFLGSCLAGEAGEVANNIKKIARDGESKELWENLDEECVDVMIYLVMLLIVAGTDFDKAWNAKFEKLQKRWENKDKGGTYTTMIRDLQRRK